MCRSNVSYEDNCGVLDHERAVLRAGFICSLTPCWISKSFLSLLIKMFQLWINILGHYPDLIYCSPIGTYTVQIYSSDLFNPTWWHDTLDYPSHTTILVSRHFSLYTIIILYTDFSAFWLENIDSQPQIPAEEATIEGQNVCPGLCPKRIMHKTMLRFFYCHLFNLYTIYILNFLLCTTCPTV